MAVLGFLVAALSTREATSEVDMSALSLLQVDAKKASHQHQGEEKQGEDPWPWGRNPYTRCLGVKAGQRSYCDPVVDPQGRESSAFASPHSCSLLAYEAGATAFNILPGKQCQLLKCRTANLRVFMAEDQDPDWRVHSQSCGLLHTSHLFSTKDCGVKKTAFYEYEEPPSEACTNMLRFNGRASGDIHNGLRYANALDGADLLVKALGPYESGRPDLQRHHHDHGLISVKAGTHAMLEFVLVKPGTVQEIVRPWFGVTLAGLTAHDGCTRPLSVNATHFVSYHLASDSEIVVHSTSPYDAVPPSALFEGVAFGEDGFMGDELTQAQAQRAVTLFYSNSSKFRLRVQVGSGDYGRQLKMGGASLAQCSNSKKAERGLLFAKRDQVNVQDNIAGNLMLSTDAHNKEPTAQQQ